MTFDEIAKAVAPAVPGDAANAEAIAKVHVSRAILKVGRIKDASFNKKWVTFSLTSGTSSYVIGSDILNGYPNVWTMGKLWFPNQNGRFIEILGFDEFKRLSSGGSTTGYPRWGTLHSDQATLDVYPIPDSNYTVGAYLRKKVTNLSDIDDSFHDVVMDTALVSVKALSDPNLALDLLRLGLADVRENSQTAWDENNIPIGRHVGRSYEGPGADSGNLRGG